jgi:tetratricopeptide (TPR) repeat protein
MSKKKIEDHGSGFESVEAALSRTERYIEENKKSLTIIVLVIVALVGGYLLWKKFILEPKEQEAASQLWRAEQYWAVDSFDYVLHGDGDALGVLDIIDEYGITNSENVARFYAGISYLNTGEYEKAIEQLEKFDSDDYLVSVVAIGAIGDAYVQMGKYEDAIEYFEEAAEENPNDLTSPIYLRKAGLAYAALNKYSKAISCYYKIKTDFPNSEVAKDIDKYIQVAKIYRDK